jgi:hypothetical protein
LHFHNSSFFEISIEHRSSTRYANQHFLTAIQGDLLAPMESRCSKSTCAADNGTDARAFAAAEDAAQQCPGSRADHCVLDGLAASAA